MPASVNPQGSTQAKTTTTATETNLLTQRVVLPPSAVYLWGILARGYRKLQLLVEDGYSLGATVRRAHKIAVILYCVGGSHRKFWSGGFASAPWGIDPSEDQFWGKLIAESKSGGRGHPCYFAKVSPGVTLGVIKRTDQVLKIQYFSREYLKFYANTPSENDLWGLDQSLDYYLKFYQVQKCGDT